MALLILRAYFELIRIEPYLLCGNFPALHDAVRKCSFPARTLSPHAIEQICAAVDIACACYWKHVLCLQRSAATAFLLRRSGWCAHMIIGAQYIPFRAHAWVEVNGRVVNDKPHAAEVYAVLDRC